MELLQVSEIIQLTEFFTKERLCADFSDAHDFEHTQRVVRHALDLCNALPQADRQIVHLAALLHDVARPEESASQGKIDHAQAGSKIALDFLKSIRYPEKDALRIAECIAQHRFRSNCRPTTLEAEILFDADKLDSLGATGIARSFFFAAKVGAKIHNSAQDALNNPPYGPEDTAYREYLVKLSKLPEQMLTIPGKNKAQALKTFMDAFFDQLNEEFFN